MIDRLEPTGGFTRIAGNGVGDRGFGGDGGLATSAILGSVEDLAVTADGAVLFTDFDRVRRVERVRRVTPDGVINTIAGGSPFESTPVPDGTPATGLGWVNTVDVGSDGWIYLFSDYSYKIPPAFVSTPARVISDDGLEYYEFSSNGRQIRTIHALTGGTLYEFGYDAGGRLTTVTDGDGLVTEIHRNASGAATSIAGPYGRTTTVVEDGNGWLSRLTAPGDRTTTFTHSASGLLTGMVDANDSLWAFTYDSQGRLTKDSGPAGGSEALVRTPTNRGWELTTTSALDRQTTYRTEQLESGAQRVTITAPDGTVSEHTAFENGNREFVAPDGTTTIIEMTSDPDAGYQRPVPSLVEVSTPAGLTRSVATERYNYVATPGDFSTKETWDYSIINGRTFETYYNGAARTFTTTSPTGRVTTATVDAQGRVTGTQLGALAPITFTYDSQGRLASTTQGARHSTIAYDAAGRPTVLTDALARAVTFGYDTADRVTSETLPGSRVIGFGYDDNNNVTTLTPPGRPGYTFTHTPINLTASYTPPAVPGAGSTGFLFNVDRQPTEVLRPDGQTTMFAYGSTSGRLTGLTFSRGTIAFGYDSAGRVNSLTDPGGVHLAFTYDGPLPLTETWSGGVAGGVSRTFTNDFELATESVNGALVVSFDYDDDRLVTRAGDLTIDRHPDTGLVTATNLGSTVESRDYNEFGEPSRQTPAVNGIQVFDVQTQRDDLGRITQRIEVVDGITRVFQYGYDEPGRLRTVTRNGDLVARYSYDANGNRLAAEGEAGLVEGTYDSQDRLLAYGGATHTYNANGELATTTLNGLTTTFVYDTLGALTQVTKANGDVITYAIDGRGRRVGKSVNGTRVRSWLYADQLRPIAELDGAGDVISRFVYGTRASVPEYMIRDGVTYRIFSDHLGSPRVIVDAATGQVVQRMDFHAFGEIIQDSNPGFQPFGFAAGLYDGDTGLTRFGKRDYDPGPGRWTATDSRGFHGEDTNLYGYVFNSPTNFTDPTGEFAWVAAGAVIGAAVNVTMTAIANGGQVTGRQLVAAAVSGAVAGAVGAVAGPLGGTIAKALGAASNGAASIAAAGGALGCWRGTRPGRRERGGSVPCEQCGKRCALGRPWRQPCEGSVPNAESQQLVAGLEFRAIERRRVVRKC